MGRHISLQVQGTDRSQQQARASQAGPGHKVRRPALAGLAVDGLRTSRILRTHSARASYPPEPRPLSLTRKITSLPQ